MLRALVLWLSCVFAGVLCMSCGSSGSGGGAGPFNVVGDWQVHFTADVGATTTGYGAIDSAGLAAFIDTSGNIVKFPAITGANSFSGTVTAYAVNGTSFPGGNVTVTDTAQGDVNSATSITGTLTGTPSGSFSITPLNSSVVAISGAMQGKVIGFSDTLSLTFSSNGSFSGGDFPNPVTACSVNGTLNQQGTANVFDVTYNLGPTCTSDTQTGIAFQSKTDYFNVNGGADASYLYVILLTTTLPGQVHPYVVVIYQ